MTQADWQFDDSFQEKARITEQQRRLHQRALALLQVYASEPEQLDAYLERLGSPVFRIRFGSQAVFSIMKAAQLDPGFILPREGKPYKALLNCLYALYPSAKEKIQDKGFFVIPSSLDHSNFWSHQLYHWLAHRAGLAGYQQQERHLYQRFWQEHDGTITEDLLAQHTPDELKGLQAAIRRDREALEFIFTARESIAS